MSLYRRSLTVAAVIALSFAGIGVAASAEDVPPAPATTGGRPVVDQPEQVARGLIVKTTTSTPSDSLLDATDDALGTEAEVADDDLLTKQVSTVDFDETVPADVATEAAKQIEKRGDVVWAAPNVQRTLSALPPVTTDDPYFPSQRNLWDSTYASAAYSIKAPAIWRVTKGSPDVRVAVVDTGIRKENPDLDGQLVAGYDMVTDSYTANDGDGRDEDPSDPGDWVGKNRCGRGMPAEKSSWHGTFVAGQIAAKHNTYGIAGVAPGVKVQPVRVLGRCGGWDSDILAGIAWASGGHVDGVPDNATPSQVVNLSLSGQAASSAAAKSECVAYNEAAAAGERRGSVFIAAAGNDFGNANLSIPAACSHFISVGSTSAKGFSASYSNIGSTVDISAPGGDTLVEGSSDSIRSIVDTGAMGPVSAGFARYEGTSMATPQVSAGAALLVSLGMPANEVSSAFYYGAVSHFRSRSSSYADKRVKIGGQYFYFDLNCAGHAWCGRGILDLGRVQYPMGKVELGEPVVGEVLSPKQPEWLGSSKGLRYEWYRDGNWLGNSSTYTPKPVDRGHLLSVKVMPDASSFEAFSTTSDPVVVPDSPDVDASWGDPGYRYGFSPTVSIWVGKNLEPAADGRVEIRRGSEVLAWTTTTEGRATIVFPGTKLKIGTQKVRVAYLGAGEDRASSSGTETFHISPATPKVRVLSLPSSVRHTSHAKVTLSVSASGVPNPLGRVWVYDGKRRIVESRLTSTSGGRKTLTLPRLAKGKHVISVVFAGSSVIYKATSPTRTIKSY